MKSTSIVNNFFWRFAERCGAQIVTFIVSVVLARILAPEDYGQIALITVFTTIMQVFVDSGLGTALIQKKDADDLDFSSVFYFNFVVCLALYAIMFMAAPIIANFYKDLSLTPIIRIISLTIVISGVKGIQQSYVSRNMLFKRFFYATLGGTVFSAFLGIGLAYAGFGVWAIVAQQLSNTTIDTLILWMTVKWRPKRMFSWERLKSLLSFGWKMLASSLLDTVYNNIRSLIIGKMYSSADLAYYNQGDKFPYVIANNINTSIDSVLLPTMAGVQDDSSRVKAMTRRAIKTSTYIMAPLMMGLAFCAEPIVRLVLTDKWLACVPFLHIFCITYMFYPIHTANLNAQSYFQMPVDGLDTLYTCRKYFGVADGAFLYTDAKLDRELPQDESFERMHFLLGRYERSANEFYSEYVLNNKLFATEPVKRMSRLTENLLHGIDNDVVAKRRQENFDFLDAEFRDINELNLKSVYGAFMYPLLIQNGSEIRKALQKEKIYIPTLWPNVLKECPVDSLEYHYAADILPIPIDQRYGKEDMKRIAEMVKKTMSIKEE